jgi:plasmid stabilization system protein ParE
MKVRWSETALAEIDDIFSYIFEDSRSAAAAVVERIEGLTALLEEFPLVGHKQTSGCCQSCVILS